MIELKCYWSVSLENKEVKNVIT